MSLALFLGAVDEQGAGRVLCGILGGRDADSEQGEGAEAEGSWSHVPVPSGKEVTPLPVFWLGSPAFLKQLQGLE